MISAVFTFALITAIGELLFLHYLPWLRRLVLTRRTWEFTLHIGFMVLNLWIHWGTMTGTMTGVTAFVVSIGVCHLARFIWGKA